MENLQFHAASSKHGAAIGSGQAGIRIGMQSAMQERAIKRENMYHTVCLPDGAVGRQVVLLDT